MTAPADPGRAGGALHVRRRRRPTSHGAHHRPAASTRSARSPAPASTARTGSPRTRCSRGSCSATARRCTRVGRPAPTAAARRRTSRTGTRATRSRPRRGASSSRRTGTRSAASCGTTSASCAPTAARARAARASRCCATRSASTTGSSRSRRDLVELRNLADVAELIVECAPARKESPRAPLHPRLPEERRSLVAGFGADPRRSRVGTPAGSPRAARRAQRCSGGAGWMSGVGMGGEV